MLGKELTKRMVNIDDMIDTLIGVQKENGVEPTMQKVLFDPTTRERINISKRKRLEDEGVDLSNYCSTPDGAKKVNDKKSLSNIERGIFIYDESDLIDEVDGLYVCEHCTKIGYDGSYDPIQCDICEDCQDCKEYMNGICDGCGYSCIYNNGETYGRASDEGYELSDEDKELLEESKRRCCKRFKSDKSFSILDY